MSSPFDTIVAVSSPPGRAMRGLVRISGPACRSVVRGLLAGDASVAANVLQPHRLRLGDDTLPVLGVFFAAPHSNTGDDVFELQCPGHPGLLERIVRAAVALGARLAEPGEFTFRAFLSGKLDLTQAEGVAATIAATSDAQLDAASHLRRGELGRVASELVDAVVTQLALVEAGIDFVDQEDVVPIGPDSLDENLAAIESRLGDLLRHSRSWGAVEALPRIVLVGPPSAGKSTLFNVLLGRDRAVTSPVPGTTRDVLAEPLKLRTAAGREMEVMLVDIAGLDRLAMHEAGSLDRQIESAARAAIEQADLLLLLDDPSQGAAGIAEPPTIGVPILRVRGKDDLFAEVAEKFDDSAAFPPCDLAISTHTGKGLDDLRRAIAERIGERGVSVGGEMLTLQPRHENNLRAALTSIAKAREHLEPQRRQPSLDHADLIAAALRLALDDLAELGGQMSPDDVIGRIFATFCVGK